jgi:hypothetical protein
MIYNFSHVDGPVATSTFLGSKITAAVARWHVSHLTNRWSQPLAAVMSTFDLMKPFPVFATFAAASGGSAPSR